MADEAKLGLVLVGSATQGCGGNSTDPASVCNTACTKAVSCSMGRVARRITSHAASAANAMPARAMITRRVRSTSITSLLAKFRSRMRGGRDRRLAIMELRSLDGRSLRDMGISRCDIEYFARHGDRCE